MALYDTRFGLQQSVVDYLNQGLPSISGIFQPSGPSIPTPLVEAPTIEDVITEEGIASLYPQVAASGDRSYSVFNPDPTRVSGPIDMSQSAKPTNIYNYPPGSFEDDYYNRLAEKGILEYGTADYFPQKSGIETLMDTIKNNPIIQGALALASPLGTAAKGIGGFIGGMLPVNERAIQEKALRQMGYSIDDIGRIVQGPGDYVTPENIMAGYNAYRMTPETFDKRIESILNRSLPQTEASRAKIAAIQLGKQDFLDSEKLTEIRKQAEFKSKNAEALAKQKAIEDAARAKREFQQKTEGAARQAEAAKQAAAAKKAAAEKAANDAAIRRSGGENRGRDAPSSGTGRGATSATSSGLGGLGFSDKRLKENIELIGKSPSNINIYKFNYKNNPTTYQGVMADEVSWASVKHPNGYMMVDYNKIDVEFKKI
jgi:hypothetical protein